jgi:hypothetical protein
MAAINDATAVVKNFKIDSNDTWKDTIVTNDRAEAAINLTDFNLFLTIKRGSVVKEILSLDAGLSLGQNSNEVNIEKLITLPPNEYNYRVRAVHTTSGYTFSIIKGMLTINED